PPIEVEAPVPAHMADLLKACGWTGDVPLPAGEGGLGEAEPG
ncbi:MAG: hypothetical protein JWN07_1401, partial [Hyphomicrobiales bacterium]|nr:hypothetical protein [Hyphomicrobiales bacterium]